MLSPFFFLFPMLSSFLLFPTLSPFLLFLMLSPSLLLPLSVFVISSPDFTFLSLSRFPFFLLSMISPFPSSSSPSSEFAFPFFSPHFLCLRFSFSFLSPVSAFAFSSVFAFLSPSASMPLPFLLFPKLFPFFSSSPTPAFAFLLLRSPFFLLPSMHLPFFFYFLLPHFHVFLSIPFSLDKALILYSKSLLATPHPFLNIPSPSLEISSSCTPLSA
ncbi:unnamed protein product [Acanthosepion pharaonis]|uniref:Uncharacterized protein n=1 Tax=Acanthosepion pharaonis TaxID=158019 RepID=A0A812AVP9_ACAPH|nr:unnamed protein product [Sepia pharaonis]